MICFRAVSSAVAATLLTWAITESMAKIEAGSLNDYLGVRGTDLCVIRSLWW
jgi:hypothetical protein